MPLFGKHKNTAASTRESRTNDKHDDADRQRQHAIAGELYGDRDHNDGRYPTQGFDHNVPQNQSYPNNNSMNTRQPEGPGSNLGSTGPNPQVPPVSHINTTADTHGGGGGGRLAGRAERAVGSLVGSQALKEKGFQKEHEAGAFKMQSAEIAEAERLEKEALMRRERAVAHGAHPDNRHLGGLQNANTLSDVTHDGRGAPGGDPYASGRF